MVYMPGGHGNNQVDSSGDSRGHICNGCQNSTKVVADAEAETLRLGQGDILNLFGGDTDNIAPNTTDVSFRMARTQCLQTFRGQDRIS